MKLIVISSSKNSITEPKIIRELFENGLERFHLRKPTMSTVDMIKLIESIPEHFHNRMVVHSHHKLAGKYDLGGVHLTGFHRRRKFSTWLRLKMLMMRNDALSVSTSFHKLGHVYTNNISYNYILLGTIFDRLSGKFNAGYSEHSIRAVIQKTPVPLIARGGTTAESIPMCADLGFHGIAYGSCIWNAESPVAAWQQIMDAYRVYSNQVK